VRDHHNLAWIPNPGGLAKLPLKDPNSPRSANVMGHKHIGFHPDVISCLHLSFPGGAGEDLLSQRHKAKNLTGNASLCNKEFDAHMHKSNKGAPGSRTFSDGKAPHVQSSLDR